MKCYKPLLALLLVVTMALALPAAYASSSFNSTTSTVKFDKMYYSVALGEVLKPALLTTAGKSIAIKSIQVVNGADVIRVEKGNVIKPLKLGYAMIVATATNGEKAETSVNVYEGIVTPTYKLALTVGESTQLKLLSKNNKALISEILYSSFDPTIASIGPDGTITGLAPGETMLSMGNIQESINVKVGVFAPDDPAKASYVTLDNLNLMLSNTYVNNVSLLEASATKPAYPVLNDGDLVVQLGQVKMTSSDPSILTVVNKGFEYNVIYAKKAGKANLTVIANGLSKVFPITVTAEPKIKSVKIIKKDVAFMPVTWDRIKIGLDMYLVLEVTYVDGTSRELMGSYEGVTWKSSNPSIAVVSDHGMRGLKVGDVTITATYKGVSSSFKMKIVTGQH